mmetsp:Transcript_49326/g.148526  ORF Transcript_49326/g.148526 Transcript_49326/m.148526 type:complete len:202 (+) Transcript_49326:535-1140(+)
MRRPSPPGRARSKRRKKAVEPRASSSRSSREEEGPRAGRRPPPRKPASPSRPRTRTGSSTPYRPTPYSPSGPSRPTVARPTFPRALLDHRERLRGGATAEEVRPFPPSTCLRPLVRRGPVMPRKRPGPLLPRRPRRYSSPSRIWRGTATSTRGARRCRGVTTAATEVATAEAPAAGERARDIVATPPPPRAECPGRPHPSW